MTRFLALALVFFLPVSVVAQEFEELQGAYVDAVKDRFNATEWSQEELASARATVQALAECGNPRALDVLSVDGNKLAERLADLLKERNEALRQNERRREKLDKETGTARTELEDAIGKDEKRLVEIVAVLPSLEVIRDLLFEGVLTATERSAELAPEEAWSVLVAYFENDTTRFYKLDQRVRDLDARLAATREKITAEMDDDKKATLEKLETKLVAVLEVERVRFDQSGQLKDRRVKTLGKLFAELPKGMATKQQNELRARLKDDVPWPSRSISCELLGHLPVSSAVADLTTVMKRSAKNARDVEKDLVPLREKYQRALKALVTSLAGGGNTVPVSVLNNKNQTEAELKRVSERGYGESRVLESCVVGLGAAVSGREGKERKDGIAALLKLVKERDPELRTRAVEAVGRVDTEETRGALRTLVSKEKDLRVRLAALDSLAELKDEATVELCITELLRSSEWRIRAAAMDALVAIPRKNAVPALIQSVAGEVGRLVDDAERSLLTLTGRTFNGDANLWKDWWQKNKETFEIGAAAVAVATADGGSTAWKNAPGKVSFYGIQTRSNRILFVIDRSGSMLEPVGKSVTGAGSTRKIDAAKAQLKSAIAGLEDGDLFNIISYSADVSRWQKRMVKMATRSRSKVERHIDKEIEANGGTNIHDALQEAFRLAGIGAMDKAYESNVDTIFFLTDGMPSVGEVQEPAEILRRVKEWNRLARVVLHTVGVGLDHDAAFLRRLAEENGGQYTSR